MRGDLRRIASAIVAAPLLTGAGVAAAQTSLPGQRCCLNPATHVHGRLSAANKPKPSDTAELLTDAGAPLAAPGDFHIQLNASAALRANPAALGAFQRAAAQWEARINDPILITIDAGLGALGSNVIGETSAVVLAGDHDLVTEILVLDAYDENDDDIVAALPSAVGFSQIAPVGTSNSGVILASKANFKAMGFEGLDAQFGAGDGSVTFSSDFSFDYDNRDGVDAGKVDFETVASHEIGHLLGFLSIVDAVNGGFDDTAPFTLDLLRFPNNTLDDPSTLPQFRLNNRIVAPGGNQILDDLLNEIPFSTGVIGGGALGGDGFQASHWKADDLTGVFIGLMDPTLGNGVAYGVQETDLRALDLIGYDIDPIPEPSGIAVLALLGGMLARRRGLAGY